MNLIRLILVRFRLKFGLANRSLTRRQQDRGQSRIAPTAPGSGSGSSNGADQGNNFTQAMILGVPRQPSLFLAACQLVHDLYYSSPHEKRS